jgi:tRNA pseudouridine55 synthase
LNGVVVVDKPIGPTSHDVVDIVRRALRTRRVGHTGTLDPFASGVLPICVGKATRLARFLTDGEKVYQARVRLGFATTTDDLHGDPLGPECAVAVGEAAVARVAREFVGEILQVPPRFSAKRTEGRRHHDLARAGRDVERVACRVTVRAIDVGEIQGAGVEITVRCGAGTYIRALARDIGERLGVGGHLVALRRLRSGPFTVDDAVSLDAVRNAGEGTPLLPLSRLLPEIPAVTIGAGGVSALRYGRDLGRDLVVTGFPEDPPARVRVFDEAGALVALAVPRGFGAPVPGLPREPVLHPDLVLID